jgi:outer membrane protein assembly factor BamB
VDGDGVVWVGSEDGLIYGIDPDGKGAWTQKTEGPISSSPAIGPHGQVVVGSRDHAIYMLF